MATASLDGVWAKLRRAEAQLDEFQAILTAYIKQYEYTFARDKQPREGGWYHVRVVMPDPPLDYGVLVGEYIHNLRSSLDHTVWQLVILNGRRPRGSNQFPVARSLAGWRKALCRHQLLGVSSQHAALIRRFQPFHRGDRAKYHPLATLTSLSNEDKHRIVHAASLAVIAADLEITLKIDPPVAAHQIEVFPGSVIDGADLFRFRSWPLPGQDPMMDRHVNMEIKLPTRVLFGRQRIGWIDLHRLGRVVTEIVQAVAPDFPS
jgi:hypothetical protein